MFQAKGFSLTELLIAMAVVGILLAIGVPSYQQHIDRATFAEVMNFVAEQKNEVAEFAATKQRTPYFGEHDFYETFKKRGTEMYAYSWLSIDHISSYVIEVRIVDSRYEELIQYRGISDATSPWLVNWECVVSATDFGVKTEARFAPTGCQEKDLVI